MIVNYFRIRVAIDDDDHECVRLGKIDKYVME